MKRPQFPSSAPSDCDAVPPGHPSRRRFLRAVSAGAAAATLTPLAGALATRSARASDREVVMSMSGGSFMQNWQKHIIDPFQKKTGIRVKMVPGSMKAHAMQLRASRGTPPFDMFLGDGADFVHIVAAGLLLPLTPDKVPSINDVAPKFRDQWNGFGSHFDYSSVGLAIRTDRIKNPPASWREFVERGAAGEFGKTIFFNNLPAGVRGPEMLLTLSRVFGRDQKDVDAGFAAIKRLKPYTFKYFSSFNDPVVLLTNGEGDIGPGWDGRTYIAHDESGGKINWIKPKEGPASNGPIAGVVKGGNTEGAYQLINYALSAEAQKAFCEAMFYGSVNSKVQYSEQLAKRIPAIDDIHVFDEKFMADHVGQWIERWNREIAV
jgi:putative spermidine/putrescine transport system substrate-binding protein